MTAPEVSGAPGPAPDAGSDAAWMAGAAMFFGLVLVFFVVMALVTGAL